MIFVWNFVQVFESDNFWTFFNFFFWNFSIKWNYLVKNSKNDILKSSNEKSRIRFIRNKSECNVQKWTLNFYLTFPVLNLWIWICKNIEWSVPRGILLSNSVCCMCNSSILNLFIRSHISSLASWILYMQFIVKFMILWQIRFFSLETIKSRGLDQFESIKYTVAFFIKCKLIFCVFFWFGSVWRQKYHDS